MTRRNTTDDFIASIESFRQQPSAVKIFVIVIGTIAFVVSVCVLVVVLVVDLDIYSEISAFIILALAIIVSCLMYGAGFLLTMQNINQRERRQQRKRRKQIREAGLDQVEEGERAMSSKELEERYNLRQAQRQTQMQNNERRRPAIVLLNEKPSNETLLKKMIFKGKITGEKCSICKLDLRKKQTIVRCPKCLALFHYDHLSNWLEKNNDCPVCDEILVK